MVNFLIYYYRYTFLLFHKLLVIIMHTCVPLSDSVCDNDEVAVMFIMLLCILAWNRSSSCSY